LLHHDESFSLYSLMNEEEAPRETDPGFRSFFNSCVFEIEVTLGKIGNIFIILLFF